MMRAILKPRITRCQSIPSAHASYVPIDFLIGLLCRATHRRRPCGGGAQRLSVGGAAGADRDRGAERSYSEGTLEDRRAGGVPLDAGAAICAPGEVAGRGTAFAVPARHLDWRHARGAGGGGGGRAFGLGSSELKGRWNEEYRAWREARLGKDRWVYLWADGIACAVSSGAPRDPRV